MASIAGSSNQKLLQNALTIDRRPLMLKDYLLDDLSSCSSSGFKSFPRRQCCTTVRFLLEVDLKSRNANKNKQVLVKRSRSRAAAATTVSVLHRASEAVVKAVMLLPLPEIRSTTRPSPSLQIKRKKGLLPRSFSRRRWKRSFWRKSDNEGREKVQKLKSFREFLEEQANHSDDKSNHFKSTSSFTGTGTTATTVTSSKSSTSTRSDSNNDSWSESEFTSSREKSEIIIQNDAVAGKKDLPRQASTVGEDSIKGWPNEKEKSSPVSVLDCPFQDDEDVSSPFHCSLARLEGRQQKVMQKIRRFESLAQLEPVDLAKRIALSEMDDLESLKYSASPSTNIDNKEYEEYEEEKMFNEHDGESETEARADELVKQVKSTIPSSNALLTSSKIYNVLLDFFEENIGGNKTQGKDIQDELLKEAADWVDGQQELFLGWEVKDGKKLCLKDMEKNGRWRNLEEENQELALELEQEIFTDLVNELFDS